MTSEFIHVAGLDSKARGREGGDECESSANIYGGMLVMRRIK